jgi:hypothetical protein
MGGAIPETKSQSLTIMDCTGATPDMRSMSPIFNWLTPNNQCFHCAFGLPGVIWLKIATPPVLHHFLNVNRGDWL